MQSAEKPLSFFQARENFLLAMARHNNQEQKLFALFGVSNSADLDDAILRSRSRGIEHRDEIALLSTLGNQLDRASDEYDFATEKQRRQIKQQQQFDNHLRTLDE